MPRQHVAGQADGAPRWRPWYSADTAQSAPRSSLSYGSAATSPSLARTGDRTGGTAARRSRSPGPPRQRA